MVCRNIARQHVNQNRRRILAYGQLLRGLVPKISLFLPAFWLICCCWAVRDASFRNPVFAALKLNDQGRRGPREDKSVHFGPSLPIRLRGGGAVQSTISGTHKSRVLVAIGGTSNGSLALSSIESLWQREYVNKAVGHEVVKKWKRDNAFMTCGRDSLAVVSCGSRVFAIGGYNGSVELCSAESIDLACQHPTWKMEPRLRKRRSNVGAAVVGSKLFVVGGYNGTHDLPNVEVLQLQSDGARESTSTWLWGPQMAYRRSGSAVASLRGRVYALGGYDGTRLLETVEELSSDFQTWTRMPDLLNGPRGGAAAAAVAGRLYIIGGGGAQGRLARVESLDPREGRWRPEPAMNAVRSGPAAVGIESSQEIYVVGGFDGQRQLRTVERYDVRRGASWVTEEAALLSPRWGCGVAAPELADA